MRASTFVRDKRTKEITRCVANKNPRTASTNQGENQERDQCGLFQRGGLQEVPLCGSVHWQTQQNRGRTIRLTDRTYSAAEQRDQLEETKIGKQGTVVRPLRAFCSALKNAYGARRLKVRGERRARLTMFAKCCSV
ncbi:hypothetical protein [Pasteuria penetrans]|uniref:hypothetical protein n=1 Tax=Pasteuria penetrans TaxID=86005 RepID=UPI0011EE795D|nr:hypothetical protein [Pasteuria penetrans]